MKKIAESHLRPLEVSTKCILQSCVECASVFFDARVKQEVGVMKNQALFTYEDKTFELGDSMSEGWSTVNELLSFEIKHEYRAILEEVLCKSYIRNPSQRFSLVKEASGPVERCMLAYAVGGSSPENIVAAVRELVTLNDGGAALAAGNPIIRIVLDDFIPQPTWWSVRSESKVFPLHSAFDLERPYSFIRPLYEGVEAFGFEIRSCYKMTPEGPKLHFEAWSGDDLGKNGVLVHVPFSDQV